MKTLSILIAAVSLFASCRNGSPPPATSQESKPISVTQWTEKTELFMEYPPLVAGQKARFAVHLTDLGSFKPLTAGRVTIELLSSGGRAEAFQTDGPSRPGIFGLDVEPSTAGTFAMEVHLDSATVKDTHKIREVQIQASAEAAQTPSKPEEVGAIRFLKEQQWTLDFATEVVSERALQESLRVPAEVRPRTGGEVEITAPVAGRLAAASAIPGVGTLVQRGQVVAKIIPRTSAPADYPVLALAVEEATTALQLAGRDLERAQRLFSDGAVPGKRLDEAKATEATARARLQAAQERIKQHESSRTAEGDPPGGIEFVLRVPISGVIAASQGVSGASVEEGENLFRVVATDPVYVIASVPEAESWRLRQLAGGELELVQQPKPLPLGRVISVGRVVDTQTRTLPVVFEALNSDARLAVGQSVFVRLFTSTVTKAPAVPESALVDDAGRPIVFIQIAGESFMRRPVRLGNREAGYVHILDGVKSGERVVTRGAYQIRLAALSPQIPAHGHVH